MPNKDETGPEGKGRLTGRQLGKCEGAKSVAGRRCRLRRRCRRGFEEAD